MPLGNLNRNRIVATLGVVILFQLLPQPMNLNPDDWIRLWIKILLPAKGLYADGVLFEALRSPGNSSIGHKLKQLL